MSVYQRPAWDHHGGFYRSVDLNVPWIASPPFKAEPLPPTLVHFQPIVVPSPSRDLHKPIPSENKKRRDFGVFQILKEWMGNVYCFNPWVAY